MKDLINLTFCCQQATVITDFTNLKEVGHDHYMNIHGGCASMEELEQLDGVETAVLLIEDNEGTITRYGVVYDNGMQLSQLYDGKHLPCYHYEADMTASEYPLDRNRRIARMSPGSTSPHPKDKLSVPCSVPALPIQRICVSG